jgi:hypothetical protein
MVKNLPSSHRSTDFGGREMLQEETKDKDKIDHTTVYVGQRTVSECEGTLVLRLTLDTEQTNTLEISS